MTMDGITYREDFGCWWPDYDHKPEKCFEFVQTRLSDMDLAIKRCRKHDVCIQAGGHAGFWPKRLAKTFKHVHTFECEPKLLECMKRNIGDTPNIMISGEALGAKVMQAKMLPHVSAGSWRIDFNGTVPVNVTTIDALNLPALDALFLDIEGYEVEALKGAKDTIRKFYPVIHVEELPRSKLQIQTYLKNIGYRRVAQIHLDAVYVR